MKKECKHCGTQENLRTNKNGVVYNCCIHCYKSIEVPERILRSQEGLKKKHGVSDIGELRQKRLRENPPKPKKKKKLICKYCNTDRNLVSKVGKKRILNFPVCQDHWELYQKEKQEKRCKSNIEKFGTACPMHIEEINQKMRKKITTRTEEERELIYEKKKKTNLERYGVEHPAQMKEFQDKTKKTLMEKYGVANPMHVGEFKEKQKKTCLEKYGTDNPLKNKKIKNKVLATNKKKYGGHSPLVNKNIRKKANKTRREKYWNQFLILLKNKYIVPLFDKKDYVDLEKDLAYKCLKCDKTFVSTGTEPQRICCTCYHKTSSYEYDICKWLNEIGIEIAPENKNTKFMENKLNGFTVDIFLPKYKFAIDFHGLYWHSDVNVRKTYHKEKYKYFKDLGIHYIQIFENEWLAQKHIITSLIQNKLGMNKKIYGRSCRIEVISTKLYREFIEINHMQGYAPCALAIGLYHKDELVCVGAFGVNRFSKSKNKSYELIRFANKINISVTGGFNKIIKYFEKKANPLELISFIDVRYFTGKGYLKNGFVLVDETAPNYFYFEKNNPSVLYNRMHFQKHKLKYKLENFDPLLSEYENMLNHGYLRIYDAGNLKMIKKYNQDT